MFFQNKRGLERDPEINLEKYSFLDYLIFEFKRTL
jgi:hypothetical protein